MTELETVIKLLYPVVLFTGVMLPMFKWHAKQCKNTTWDRQVKEIFTIIDDSMNGHSDVPMSVAAVVVDRMVDELEDDEI